MQTSVSAFMVLMGLAIAGVWTRDIVASPEVDRSQGLLRAREPGSGSLFWPHWLAEYGTAATLIAGGVGLFLSTSWAGLVAPCALGALVYTSTNALGWAFARRERFPYAVPMIVGAVGGVASMAAFAIGGVG